MEVNFRKKIGNLELCPNTYLNGKKSDSLEICQWDNDDRCKWTIATFEYDKKDEFYYIKECGTRLDDTNFSWFDFGYLVSLGRKYLDVMKESVDD